MTMGADRQPNQAVEHFGMIIVGTSFQATRVVAFHDPPSGPVIPIDFRRRPVPPIVGTDSVGRL